MVATKHVLSRDGAKKEPQNMLIPHGGYKSRSFSFLRLKSKSKSSRRRTKYVIKAKRRSRCANLSRSKCMRIKRCKYTKGKYCRSRTNKKTKKLRHLHK